MTTTIPSADRLPPVATGFPPVPFDDPCGFVFRPSTEAADPDGCGRPGCDFGKRDHSRRPDGRIVCPGNPHHPDFRPDDDDDGYAALMRKAFIVDEAAAYLERVKAEQAREERPFKTDKKSLMKFIENFVKANPDDRFNEVVEVVAGKMLETGLYQKAGSARKNPEDAAFSRAFDVALEWASKFGVSEDDIIRTSRTSFAELVGLTEGDPDDDGPDGNGASAPSRLLIEPTGGMIGFRFADGGREASGRKGKAGDCVTRAASLLLAVREGLDFGDFGTDEWGSLYDATYKRLAIANRDGKGGSRTARNGIFKQDYEPVFLNDFGFQKVRLGKGTRPTYSEAYRRFGNCIVKTRKHVAAIIGGLLLDLQDDRTYEWEDEYGDIETRQRKAMSIYTLPASDEAVALAVRVRDDVIKAVKQAVS